MLDSVIWLILRVLHTNTILGTFLGYFLQKKKSGIHTIIPKIKKNAKMLLLAGNQLFNCKQEFMHMNFVYGWAGHLSYSNFGRNNV